MPPRLSCPVPGWGSPLQMAPGSSRLVEERPQAWEGGPLSQTLSSWQVADRASPDGPSWSGVLEGPMLWLLVQDLALQHVPGQTNSWELGPKRGCGDCGEGASSAVLCTAPRVAGPLCPTQAPGAGAPLASSHRPEEVTGGLASVTYSATYQLRIYRNGNC